MIERAISLKELSCQVLTIKRPNFERLKEIEKRGKPELYLLIEAVLIPYVLLYLVANIP